MRSGEDGGEGEEAGVWEVGLVVGDGGEVGAQEGGEEGVGFEQVRAKVREGSVCEGGDAGEDVDAEGAVERDGLLEVDGVGVGDAGDVGGAEDAAGGEGGAAGVEEWGGGGVRGRVVVDVGGVGDAVARGEFAAGFEDFDEFVGRVFGGGAVAGVGGGGLGGEADFAGGGLAAGEEGGVFGVEVEKVLGDEFALGFVGGEGGAGCEA